MLKSQQEKMLLEPYNYICLCNGTQMRSKFIEAFNHWLQIPDDKLKIGCEVMEMLYNASLLIDGMDDNSAQREGSSGAHTPTPFTLPLTLNSANYVYFLGLEKIVKELPKEVISKAVVIFSDQILELFRGQGLDIHWRNSGMCPTEAEYLSMIGLKMGSLIGLGLKLMQLFSTDSRDYTKLMTIFITYLQIRNDYTNLKSNESEENKGFCEDITEGKFTFPIIHGIQRQPNNTTLINILRQRTTKPELKRYFVKVLELFGSFDYTLKVLNELEVQATTEIEALGGNLQLYKILDELKSN